MTISLITMTMMILLAIRIAGGAAFWRIQILATGNCYHREPIKGEASLYVHVPFCAKKCPYCDFFTLPNNLKDQKLYENALEREMALLESNWRSRSIVSIYFGGGTPALLSPLFVARMIGWISQHCEVSPMCEITLEANPGEISEETLAGFFAAGVNRLSFGVQSFSDRLLSYLGRNHTANQAIVAIEEAIRVGFSNISIDLMVDIPHQTVADWQASLAVLEGLGIVHLSLYNLTWEPRTLFGRHARQKSPLYKARPPEDISLWFLEFGVEQLAKIGLERYEISGFARDGAVAVHNIGYWTGRPFWGLGPAAYSYWDQRRWSNVRHWTHYLEGVNRGVLVIEDEVGYSRKQLQKELFIVQLRLIAGVSLLDFEACYGSFSAQSYLLFDRLIGEGFLRRSGEHIMLTSKGLLFYDDVSLDLMIGII